MRVTESARAQSNAGPERERTPVGAAGSAASTPIRSRRRGRSPRRSRGALGAEVRVRPRRGGGYSAELSFASPEEAIELARRVGRPALS